MKWPGWLAVVLVLGVGAPVAAQQDTACAPLDAYGTLPVACVDQRPRLDSAGIAVLQRMLLRRASRWSGFEGSFRVAFTVDTAGRAIWSSLRVLHADTGRFAEPFARNVVSEVRYLPGVRAGVRVPVAWEVQFEFAHPGDRGGDTLLAPLVVQVRQSESPEGSTVRVNWVPVATVRLTRFHTDSSRARQLEAVSAVIANTSWDSLAFACVSLLDGARRARLAPEEVDRLRAVRQRVARPGECPESYSTGWAVVNPDGTLRERPAGAGPDPYGVEVDAVVPWTEDWIVAALMVRRSGGTEKLRCESHRSANGRWSPRCETTARWIF
jgi:hypothetical protein